MARRVVATDWQSDAWESSFSFLPDAEFIPEVAAMKALGVHKINMRIGCTRPGEFFTDLVEVVAEKGVAVDVFWLRSVRDLCESMTPAMIAELGRSTVPDEDDPDGHYQEEVAIGNFLLSVVLAWQDNQAALHADFSFPAAESDGESLMVRRDTRKLRASPPSVDGTLNAAGQATTAAE